MYEKITLKNLMNGELEEKFQHELDNVKNNIGDLKTETIKPREIIIKIKFTPNDERTKIACISSVTSKLVPIKDTGAILTLAPYDNKLELYHETSREMSLFNEEDELNQLTSIGNEV